MKSINATNAPDDLRPYCHAVVVDSLVFTSGQIPLNQQGEVVSEDVKEQTKQVLENLKVVLQESGASLDSVVKSLIFIKDMNDFQDINAVYVEYFNEHLPARSCVEVARLPKDVKVEIEMIAKINN